MEAYNQSHGYGLPNQSYGGSQGHDFYQSQQHTRGETLYRGQTRGQDETIGDYRRVHASTVGPIGSRRGEAPVRSRSYNRNSSTQRPGQDLSRGQTSYSQPPYFRQRLGARGRAYGRGQHEYKDQGQRHSRCPNSN